MSYPVPLGHMRLLDAIPKAMAHTQATLFAPFQIEKWFRFGIIIFLASLMYLNGGGGGGGFNPFQLAQWRQQLEEKGIGPMESMEGAAHFLENNMATVMAGILLALVIMFAIMFALMWVQSRAAVMFVRATATGDPAFGENWNAVRAPAQSLFNFYLLYYSTVSPLGLLLFGGAAILVMYGFLAGAQDATVLFVGAGLLVVLGILLAIAGGILTSFVRGFVMPIALRRGITMTEAGHLFLPIARENIASLIAFLVYRFLLGIAYSMAGAIACCCTICIAALPVIQQTVFAPLLVFDRAVPLFMLAQLGPDFDLFPRPPEPEVVEPEFAFPEPPEFREDGQE